MAEALAPVFSRIDALKRQLYDMITNPRDYASMLGGRVMESAAQREAVQQQAFANPQNPLQITNPQALNQLTNMIMAGEMGFAPAGITAYHGSPYLFRQFDPMKVGTGEGAQAYGVGAGYTAEARPVASSYLPKTSEEIAQKINVLESELDKFKSYLRVAKKINSPDIKVLSEKINELKTQIEQTKKSAGYLYKGEIPDEILPKFLDWDKPLNQQPHIMSALRSEAEQRVRSQKLIEIENDIRASRPAQNVGDDYLSMFSDANAAANQEIQKEAINKLNKMDLSSIIEKELETMKPKDMNWNMTGKELYEFLAKNQGSAQQASVLLDRQGVRGIRYLDQGSRTGGSNTSNFVPFRPEDYKIESINDIPIQQYIEQGLL